MTRFTEREASYAPGGGVTAGILSGVVVVGTGVALAPIVITVAATSLAAAIAGGIFADQGVLPPPLADPWWVQVLKGAVPGAIIGPIGGVIGAVVGIHLAEGALIAGLRPPPLWFRPPPNAGAHWFQRGVIRAGFGGGGFHAGCPGGGIMPLIPFVLDCGVNVAQAHPPAPPAPNPGVPSRAEQIAQLRRDIADYNQVIAILWEQQSTRDDPRNWNFFLGKVAERQALQRQLDQLLLAP